MPFVAASRCVSGGNGGCLDLWNGNGPQVGIYSCWNGVNQQWDFNASSGHLTSMATQACVTSNGAGDGQFMVDEFGNGELTFYGPFVTDYCVAAC